MMNSVRACLGLKGGEVELFIELGIFRGGSAEHTR